MTMESDLVTVLKTVCTRVHPGSAPLLELPFITYTHIGGTPLRHFDNTPIPLRHTMLQIDVHAATKASALTLIHQVEEAMCAESAPFTGSPIAEHSSEFDVDMQLHTASQDFDVWAAR